VKTMAQRPLSGASHASDAGGGRGEGRWSLRRGSLAALLAASIVPSIAWASPFFTRSDPSVQKGNDLYTAGKYEEALQAYENAEKDHPGSSEIPYDRGNALYKLGRYDEAREAYQRALGTNDQTLKADDYFNMGNAFAGMGKDDDAVDAYRRALRVEPRHEDARHNLQLVLRRKEQPPPSSGPDGGTDGGSHRDGGSDGGRGDGGGDAGAGDGGRGDGGADAGRGDGGGGDGGRGDGGGRADGGGGDGGGSQKQQNEASDGGMADAGHPDGGSTLAERRRNEEQPISRQEAEQILDSLRRNEKSFQSWKFKKLRKTPVDKDW
jgi:hypothetical protein